MQLSFVSTGPFRYLHMVSVLTAIATQRVSQVNLFYTEEPTGIYFSQVKDYVILKKVDVPQLPGLNHPAIKKDYIQWHVLDEIGGMVADLDTIFIQDLSGLLTSLMTSSLDVNDPAAIPFAFNNAIVMAEPGTHLTRSIRRFVEAMVAMGGLPWGTTGPIALSTIANENLENGFQVTPHKVLNPYGGHEIGVIYEEDAKLTLPEETRFVHLYAQASPKFDKIDANWIKGSQSLLARTIKEILPDSVWSVRPPFSEAGYLAARGQHYRGLFEAIRSSQPKTILEIGTSAGETAIGMIKLAGEAWGEKNIHYFGIDLFENGKSVQWETEFSGCFVPPKMAVVKARLETETQATISLVAMDSRELSRLPPESWPPIDVLFLDGGHSLETIKSDWEFAKTAMHEKTVVVLDDYFPELPFIGAKNVVDNIDRSVFDVKIMPEIDDYTHPFGRLRTQLVVVRFRQPETVRPIAKPWAKDVLARVLPGSVRFEAMSAPGGYRGVQMTEEVYTKGYFEKIEEEEALQASRLERILYALYKPKSVIDWGCASGLYLEPFMENGCEVLGIENSPVAIEMRHPDIRIIRSDMTQAIHLTPMTMKPVGIDVSAPVTKFDMALCIEVLEHIDEQYSKVAIENVCRSSDRLVVSIAREWQQGPGHLNLKPIEYWIQKFGWQGFRVDNRATLDVRERMGDGYHLGWLTNNLLILEKI